MAFINFENLPSENTPLTGGEGGNLNVMQEIVNVSNEVDEDYRVNLLKSKNLWKEIPRTQTINGITLTNNGNGTFNLSGTATANTSFYVELYLGSTNLKNGTYTLSKKSAGYNIQLDFYNGTTYVSTPIYCYGSALENSATLSIGSSVNKVRFIIYVANGSSVSLTNEHIMLNSGSTALPYEAYIQNQIVVDNEKYSDTLNVGQFDSRSRVNVLKSNNLLNLVDGTYTDLNVVRTISNGEITLNGTPLNTNYNDTIITFKATKSGIYTLTPNKSETNSDIRFIYKVNNGSFLNSDITPQISLSIGDILTINLRISTTNTLSNFKLKPMLNYGNEATTYEPYITPSIYVDNEMLVSKNAYSTGEVVIGEWLGKPLYRKVVNFGALPNNAAKQYSLSGMNIDFMKEVKGTAYTSQKNGFNIPYPVSGATTHVTIYWDANNVSVITSNDRSAYSAYLILEYTKTTD